MVAVAFQPPVPKSDDLERGIGKMDGLRIVENRDEKFSMSTGGGGRLEVGTATASGDCKFTVQSGGLWEYV